ncbi:MAG TPA: TonB-dependent receptor [Pseudomonadales bacterium]
MTELRFDPRVDVQPRGLPEGQADVSVRGGLFENTGFGVVPVTLLDPQTGHYGAELPFHPRMLSAPDVATGIDNAIDGFNSTVATVRHEPVAVQSGGEVMAGAGDHDLRLFDLRAARALELSGGGRLGLELAHSRARGDGSRDGGDHDFERVAARVQHRAAAQQTDLLYGRQEKFFGWPGAYTGFATFAETDRTETDVLLVRHRRQLERGWWAVGGYYRRLEDDYDFDRTTQESGVPGAFEHETRSYGIAARGVLGAAGLDWHWTVQLAGDELVRSTDLTGGDFDERRYVELALVPERRWWFAGGAELSVRGGVTVDHSNRDDDAVLPVLGIVLTRPTATAVDRISIEYAASSQVPGYTALKSPPAGLFGGNPDLGRERADSVSATAEREAAAWHGRVTLFHRRDDDLVDWTFRAAAPFVRQANAVDMSVNGLELELGRRWGALELIGGLTLLHKDEDYDDAAVDASYYALNYAKQRVTLALRYAPFEWLDVRLDNELARYRNNALRTGDDDVYQAALSVGWRTPVPGLRVELVADNLTNDDFQHFPGTPPPRRQVSLQARWGW